MDNKVKISLTVALFSLLVLILIFQFRSDAVVNDRDNTTVNKEKQTDNLTPEEQYEQYKEREQQKKDVSLYNRALAVQDRSLCNGISNTTMKEYCRSNISTSNINTTESDGNTSTNSDYSDDDVSLYNRALASSNKDLCKDITSAELRNKCKEALMEE